jgi:excisionase family DNA binding protein
MSAQQDTVAPVHDIARVRGELFRNQLDDVAIKAALGISRATLARYVQSGLPHYKLGRRRLFDTEAVRSWIASHQIKNGRPRRPGRPRKAS